ncbi:GDP-mannose 4,6-dehydratase, partial [Candidatus Uhrbacteria bacterium]|nr:GDP-mannose 4,6-dehydratase [Candidatus Uhrbacteria bacterium]
MHRGLTAVTAQSLRSFQGGRGNALLEGKKIPIYGDGQQIREWIHVWDFASAVDAVLHQGKVGEIYNLGTRCRTTNLEVAHEILKLLGKDESFIEHVQDRAGHDRRYAVNSDKLRKQLGWKPEYDFERALAETVHWY